MAVDLKGHLAAEREECPKEGTLPTLRHICEIPITQPPTQRIATDGQKNSISVKSRFGRGNNVCTVLNF